LFKIIITLAVLNILFIGCANKSIVKELGIEDKTFIKEYKYDASEDDSKNSAREKAILQLKSILSEEVGTYIISYLMRDLKSVNGNAQTSIKHNIQSFSTAITFLEIIDESWNGEEYWVKASVYVSKNDIMRTLVKNREFIKKIEDSDIKEMEQQLIKYRQEEEKYIKREREYREELRIVQNKINKLNKKRHHKEKKACMMEYGMTEREVIDIIGKPDYKRDKYNKHHNCPKNMTCFYYRQVRLDFTYNYPYLLSKKSGCK
jgi:hypothetical protein